ncbi:hypothetical protein MnTg04_01091 [bacterium MnTg04]|nr:hypothetical protein MnTg04_01091 [bacterium MnTg04]
MRDGNAVQRTGIAGGPRLIGFTGLFERQLAGHRDESVQMRTQAFYPVEQMRGQLYAAEVTGS